MMHEFCGGPESFCRRCGLPGRSGRQFIGRFGSRLKLHDAGVETAIISGSSMYFTGPDGERIELISDPLGEMYGHQVG